MEGRSINPPSEFKFLTFTDFKQTTDEETKKKVRSHVTRQAQQDLRSRKGKGRHGEFEVDISSLSQANTTSSREPTNSVLRLPIVPYPRDLGAGRSDPFVRYPIDMDVRTHELFDHLHGKTCPMFKTLSTVGFFRTVLDEAAFRQILCTSSSHMMQLRQGTENTEAIILSTGAIRSINRRIADPIQGISDGVIITILAFACHAVMFNDVQGALTHFNGLEELIRRRGGLQAFSSNLVMRTVLFWVDVNTAFFHDHVPRFPVPDDILPRVNTSTSVLLPHRMLLEACVTVEMVSAVNELLALNQFIMSELAVRDLWEDGIFAGLRVVPLMSRFLSIREHPKEYNTALARQESCRIGALLYLAGIRQRFGVNLASDIYIPKLKHAIKSQADLNLEEIRPILVWLLVIGGIQSFSLEDHFWFVSAIADLAARQLCSNWEHLMSMVGEVSWVEGILEPECDELRKEVSSASWNSYGCVFS